MVESDIGLYVCRTWAFRSSIRLPLMLHAELELSGAAMEHALLSSKQLLADGTIADVLHCCSKSCLIRS